MISDATLRSNRRLVEEYSEQMNRITDNIVSKYSRDLDTCIDDVRQLLNRKDKLSDEEVEDLTLEVPIYMYYAVSGLENIGIQMDSAKTIKMGVYNGHYMEAAGTISDKTAQAENATLPEYLMQVCFERAYKQLKLKVDVATQLCQATRKVLQKRISDMDIHRGELNYNIKNS